MDNFFNEMALLLELDSSIVNEDLDLTKLEIVPWDSLAVVSTIAIIDEIFDITVDGRSLSGCKKLQDIINLINSKKS